MSWCVVINLGLGNLVNGCPDITVQFSSLADESSSIQCRGSLPPDPQLQQLYQQWQLLYREFYQEQSWLSSRTIRVESSGVTHFSRIELDELCEQLKTQLNKWLNSEAFRPVERRLSRLLAPKDEILIILETDNELLRRLPWHLWDFFEDYRQAEIALSPLEYAYSPAPQTVSGQVRILAVLGNSEGLDLQPDRISVEALPDAAPVFLKQPKREELSDRLWETLGWDILFFAGHSETEKEGWLYINQTEAISLEQLRHALKQAVSRGLKLAIFNSCDGLGLLQALSDVSLPQIIVMREPVPDVVAQAFFQHFLTAFASGKSLPVALREARERLEKLEGQYPYATWLPVMCQHRAVVPAKWQEWRGSTHRHHSLLDRLRVHAAFGWSLLGASSALAAKELGWFSSLELIVFLFLTRIQEEPSQPVQSVANRSKSETEGLHQELQLLEPGTYALLQFVVTEQAKTNSFHLDVDLTRPTVTEFPNLPSSPISTSVEFVDVRFSEAIDGDAFDSTDILLKRDGKALIVEEIKIELLDEVTYRIEGLAGLTQVPGHYELSIDTNGIYDRAGNSGTMIVTTAFSIDEEEFSLSFNVGIANKAHESTNLNLDTLIDILKTDSKVQTGIASAEMLNEIEIWLEDSLPSNRNNSQSSVMSLMPVTPSFEDSLPNDFRNSSPNPFHGLSAVPIKDWSVWFEKSSSFDSGFNLIQIFAASSSNASFLDKANEAKYYESALPAFESLSVQTAIEYLPFSFTVPEDTFVNFDRWDRLQYSATLANGQNLPQWLTFDAETRTFRGIPRNGDAGTLRVLLTVTDRAGSQATESFIFKIEDGDLFLLVEKEDFLSGNAITGIEEQDTLHNFVLDSLETVSNSIETVESNFLDWNPLQIGSVPESFLSSSLELGSINFSNNSVNLPFNIMQESELGLSA